jgi:hypothetical protein
MPTAAENDNGGARPPRILRYTGNVSSSMTLRLLAKGTGRFLHQFNFLLGLPE